MNTKNQIKNTFKNTVIDTKLKLSALWIGLMFLFVYADIKTLYQSGVIEEIITGKIIGIQISNIFLLVSAILMSIPAIMIILSVLLKPQINRILNIVFASMFIIINIGTYFMPGETWYYYVYFTSLENIINITILWFAWKWPKQEVNK
jgi:hypothetical protein